MQIVAAKRPILIGKGHTACSGRAANGSNAIGGSAGGELSLSRATKRRFQLALVQRARPFGDHQRGDAVPIKVRRVSAKLVV